MRYLIHFGLFALAATAVTQADAQDGRRADRHTTVVIARGGGPRAVQPPRAIYDSRRTVHTTSTAKHDARRAVLDQRQDLEQIVRIAERWEEATANRDRNAQSKVDRRLDAWLEREIRESVREPRNRLYIQRVRVLSDELAMLERRHHHGYGYKSRGDHGRRRSGYSFEKVRILNELIELSERQVYRAQANARYPFRVWFAYR